MNKYKILFVGLVVGTFINWLSSPAESVTMNFGGGGSSSSGASLTSANTFTGGNVFSTFTVVSNSSSTFNGPVRMTKNAFVYGPGSLAIGGVGDPSASSAYFAITRSGANNMAIEFYQDTTLRSEFSVNTSNHVAIQAFAGDLNFNAAGGQTWRLKNNSVTQIAGDTTVITFSTTSNHDGYLGLWSRTSAQLQVMPPQRAYQMVVNSDSGDVCMGTGTAISAWVLVRSTTTACD